MAVPVFRSLALGGARRFDYADVILVSRPPSTPDDPRVWAETLFSPRGAPLLVRIAMKLRDAFVPLIGLRAIPAGVFDVRRVEGSEALIEFVDDHLTFSCGIAVDAATIRVTTVVRFNDWRGRIYFTPVSLVHPLAVHATLRRTRKVLSHVS